MKAEDIVPQDIKVWEIMNRDKLKEISKSKLDFEDRLEDWMEDDISTISNDLLVIGRQVETDFGGVIDILCIDYNGDIVIVELKRDKTPREITAQVLDYASWVKDLTNERINEIANKYLSDGVLLADTFRNKFGNEVPEIINEHHKMLIVASEIDDSSERIIKYLSDTYGVAINAVTFNYFRDSEGKEFLARVFLIEPSEADYNVSKRASKRAPNLTYDELQEIAENNGVGEIYKTLVDGLLKCFDQSATTRSSIAFMGIMGENKSKNVIFSLVPGDSDMQNGVRFTVYVDRFINYFGINKETAIEILPLYKEKEVYDKWAGEFGGGYFKDNNQIEMLLSRLNELKKS
jgi:hypothetical protein